MKWFESSFNFLGLSSAFIYNLFVLFQQYTVYSYITWLNHSFDNNIRSATLWAGHWWNAEWLNNPIRLRTFIPDTGTQPLRKTLPRTAWVWLNRIHTAIAHFLSCLNKWGVALSVACECGTEKQIVNHVVLDCLICRPLHGLHGLTILDDEMIEWLLNTCPKI